MVLVKMFLGFFIFVLLILPGRAQQTVISIGVKTGLQFDLTRFQVRPGSTVKIIFTNTDDMNHNLLITRPGRRLDVVNDALALGDKGLSMNYIPANANILWAIPVLSPNDSKSITFTAPKETGVYPYVCTLPGHGFIMYGAMYVTNDTVLPDIANDLNLPPAGRQDRKHLGHDTATTKAIARPLHPYTPHAPYLYRLFIEGASPAAIAVSLTRDLSYCWDAGTCKLRFAWSGGFLDNSDLWKGKGDAAAKVIGTVFFRDKTGYPIRVGKTEGAPVVAYKGYRLINRYPEFHYTINGTDVYELILPARDSVSIVRTFRIPFVKETVAFDKDAGDGAVYKSTAGKWVENRLMLSSSEARKFSITMSKKEGAGL